MSYYPGSIFPPVVNGGGGNSDCGCHGGTNTSINPDGSYNGPYCPGGSGGCWPCPDPSVLVRYPNQHCWRIVPEGCCDKKHKKKHHKKDHKKKKCHKKDKKGDHKKKDDCGKHKHEKEHDHCKKKDKHRKKCPEEIIEIIVVNGCCPDDGNHGHDCDGGGAQGCGCAGLLSVAGSFVANYAQGIVPTPLQLAQFQTQATAYVYCRLQQSKNGNAPDVTAINSLLNYLAVPGSSYDATANALTQQVVITLRSVCLLC